MTFLDALKVLDEIEREHEAARREQIRILSACAYVPDPKPPSRLRALWRALKPF